MRYLTGSCLCKKIKIQVPDQFDFVGNCHCSECRKFSGSAFASAAGLDADDFKVLDGEDWIAYFHKTDETDLGFCRNCGSSLFSKKLRTNKYNIRLGILDDMPTQTPGFHIFAGSKAPWYEINDDFQQFEQRPGT